MLIRALFFLFGSTLGVTHPAFSQSVTVAELEAHLKKQESVLVTLKVRASSAENVIVGQLRLEEITPGYRIGILADQTHGLVHYLDFDLLKEECPACEITLGDQTEINTAAIDGALYLLDDNKLKDLAVFQVKNTFYTKLVKGYFFGGIGMMIPYVYGIYERGHGVLNWFTLHQSNLVHGFFLMGVFENMVSGFNPSIRRLAYWTAVAGCAAGTVLTECVFQPGMIPDLGDLKSGLAGVALYSVISEVLHRPLSKSVRKKLCNLGFSVLPKTAK